MAWTASYVLIYLCKQSIVYGAKNIAKHNKKQKSYNNFILPHDDTQITLFLNIQDLNRSC